MVAEGQVGRQGRVNAQRSAVLKPQLRRLFERQGLARAEHMHWGLRWRTGLGGIDTHGGQQGRPRGGGGLAPHPQRILVAIVNTPHISSHHTPLD